MKKKLIYLLAFMSILIIPQSVLAEETDASVQQKASEEKLTIENIMNYVDKDSVVPLNPTGTEFTYTVKGKLGYMNNETNFAFLSEYDKISPLGLYLKVRKNGKFGLIDKKANIILEPKYQTINIVDSDGIEYIEGKENGKYKMYYINGKPIAIDDVFTFTQNKSILLANDLRQEFKDVIAENVKLELADLKAEKGELINKTASAPDPYEISALPVPGRLKVAHVEKEVANENTEAVQQPSVDETIQTKPVSDVEKKPLKEADSFTADNKTFYPFMNGNKVGIMDANKYILIPAKYSGYKVVTPDESSKPVIVMSLNKAYTIYDLKGRLIAEQIYDKVNIYEGRNIYNFRIVDKKGYIQKNGNDIGTMVKTNGEYIYTKTGFSIKPSNVIKMIIVILDINKK